MPPIHHNIAVGGALNALESIIGLDGSLYGHEYYASATTSEEEESILTSYSKRKMISIQPHFLSVLPQKESFLQWTAADRIAMQHGHTSSATNIVSGRDDADPTSIITQMLGVLESTWNASRILHRLN